MTKPVPGAVRGRPFGALTMPRDPYDEDNPPTVYHYWIGGPPYLTDDPHPVAPDALAPLYLPLISIGWQLLRTDYVPPPSAKRAKAPNVLSTLYHHPNHPGVTLGELVAAFGVASYGSIYLHLNRMAKEGLVVVEYRKDGERLYSATPQTPPPLPKKLTCKYSWTVSQNRLIFAGSPPQLYNLSPLLIQFDWAIKRCEVGKTNTDWRTEPVSNEDIIEHLLGAPWASLASLVDLYRRHSHIDWAPHEYSYAEDNMKRKLFHLERGGKVIERDGLYNLAGE